MSNIKNLQMWRNICADVRVSIGHSFFGLKTTATYIPTDSVIDARTIDYSQQDGEKLKVILAACEDGDMDSIGNFHPKEIVNGNYQLELCQSRDGQYVCLLLKQFSRMSYEPVTNVLVFEGDKAKAVRRLYQ